MKVCLISDTVCDANGVSRFIQNFANCGKDDEFYVLTATKKDRCQKLKNIINAKVSFKMKMPFYQELDLVLPSLKDFKKNYELIDPDLVVISTPGIVGLLGLYHSKRVKKAAIYHTDFPSYIYKNTKSRFLKKVTSKLMNLFYNRFDTVLLRSNEYYETLKEEIKIDQTKLKVLKAGIDIDAFHSNKDTTFWQNYNVDQKSFKLLYVGRLSHEKNFDFLLEVFEALKQRQKNVELICCGEGRHFMEKKQELKTKGVWLLGYKNTQELSKIYANCDLFVFPSITDTLGQVVMEAQASTLPSLVSDIGGPKTIVAHEESGYVLPIEKDIWVKKIQELLNDGEKRAYFGKNAYNLMQENSINGSYAQFKNILEQI